MILSPDCLAGKCGACDGDAWDRDADAPTPCGCVCHLTPVEALAVHVAAGRLRSGDALGALRVLEAAS